MLKITKPTKRSSDYDVTYRSFCGFESNEPYLYFFFTPRPTLQNNRHSEIFHRSPKLIMNRRINRRRSRNVLSTISEINVHDYQKLEVGPVLTREQLIDECAHPPTEGPLSEDPVQRVEGQYGVIPFTSLLCGIFIYSLYVCILIGVLLAFLSCVGKLQEKTYENLYTLKRDIRMQMLEYEKLEKSIHMALRTDNTRMADYALESLGSSVIASSLTHKLRFCKQFGFSVWCRNHRPETVLQPVVYPGKCWGFKGSNGHLVIALPYPVRITHVTMEHVPKQLSHHGHTRSAPKHFAVYGIGNETKKRRSLGKFTYNRTGETIQTFEIPDSPSETFGLVVLRVLSNWGHSEYTCVYRFRVHSQLKRKCTIKF